MPKLNISFNQYESERLYPIGFQFTLQQGKQSPKECTVIDYEITYNSKGEVKSFAYVLQYPFLTQTMTYLVPQSTIDIATNNAWKNLQ